MTPRERHLLRTYGITLEQYEYLLNRQGGCCAICQKPAGSFAKRLCVDHDHKSGEIRGALCTFCNRYVIGRHRDPDVFERAASYLRLGTGWIVPPKKRKKRSRKKK